MQTRIIVNLSKLLCLMDTFSHQLDPNIKQKALELTKYTQLLKNALPPECENHFSVANLMNKSIVIVADSPVWTTRLRQLGQLILETMKNQTQEDLHHVKIITRHGPVADDHDPKVIKRQLSSSSAHILEQTATYLGDEELSNALLKLSKRKSQSSPKK